MSKQFNHLNIPSHWQSYWTRFPEGHTILEALIQWVSQVDEMVDNQNKLSDTVTTYGSRLDQFIDQFEAHLSDEVKDTLGEWQQSGFLDDVINDALDTKYHEMDDRLTTQLAQKATKEEVGQWLGNISEGTPDFVDDVVEMTDSSRVYVNLSDGYLYSHNGQGWVSTGVLYQSMGIADGGLSPGKIKGTIKTIGENLFNPETVTSGALIGSDNGVISPGFANYVTSDYIEVKPNSSIRKANMLGTAFYQSEGVLSTEKPGQTGAFIDVPSDATLIRTSLPLENRFTEMIVVGTTYPETYIPYKETFSFDQEHFIVEPSNTLNKRTINLFDPTKVTWGGYYDVAGEFVVLPSYGLSDFIEVDEGEVVSKNTIGFNSWYDVNKNWIGVWHTTRVTRVPKNAKYLRGIVQKGTFENEMIVKGFETPDHYIPYEVKKFDNTFDTIGIDELAANTSNLHEKKWVYFGDSISEYMYSYPHIIKTKYKMDTVHRALSGRSLAKRGGVTDEQYPPLVDIYQDIPVDVDIITILIGTNDKGSNIPIGDIDSTDETTFMGSYNVMLLWLLENRPDAKILLITPMQRFDSVGQTGTPLSDYVNAVKEIGQKYNQPVLDLYNGLGLYGQSEVIKQKYIPDGLHPNYAGHNKFLAPKIESALLDL